MYRRETTGAPSCAASQLERKEEKEQKKEEEQEEEQKEEDKEETGWFISNFQENLKVSYFQSNFVQIST